MRLSVSLQIYTTHGGTFPAHPLQRHFTAYVTANIHLSASVRNLITYSDPISQMLLLPYAIP